MNAIPKPIGAEKYRKYLATLSIDPFILCNGSNSLDHFYSTFTKIP